MDNEGIYSQRLRAGRRRTYFFDVRTTKGDDYYITITESKKRFNEDGYDRHKIFLYKEDFNKFVAALSNTVNHVKENLMPEYDFKEFDRDPEEYVNGSKINGYETDAPVSEPQQAEASVMSTETFNEEPAAIEEDITDEDLSF
ncbi:MAG: PUR family DNA/RNA-binding protein [Saprospiraceae bacterium]|nr:PUR family DNA/RNA-binding protein [Saprospiraceae bacterium]